MILVFAMFIGVIWGFGYIIGSIFNLNGNIIGIVIVDIALLWFGSLNNFALFGICIIVCVIIDYVLIQSINNNKTSYRRETIVKKTKAQEKCDNEYGEISWADK